MTVWFLNHIANPFVRALLRSPAHRFASGSLLLLTFTGRRSGTRYTIPVGYPQEDGSLLVRVGLPDRKRWWRNLRDRGEVGVLLRGQRRRGIAYASESNGSVVVRVRLEPLTEGGRER